MAPLALVPEIRKLDVQPGQTRYLFRRIDQTDLISPQRKPVGHSVSVSRELLVGIVRADVEQRCPTCLSAFECAREHPTKLSVCHRDFDSRRLSNKRPHSRSNTIAAVGAAWL
jgi:hypothetical protein